MATSFFYGKIRYLVGHPWNGGDPVIISGASELRPLSREESQTKFYELKKSGQYKHVKLIEIEPHESLAFTLTIKQPEVKQPEQPEVKQFKRKQ